MTVDYGNMFTDLVRCSVVHVANSTKSGVSKLKELYKELSGIEKEKYGFSNPQFESKLEMIKVSEEDLQKIFKKELKRTYKPEESESSIELKDGGDLKCSITPHLPASTPAKLWSEIEDGGFANQPRIHVNLRRDCRSTSTEFIDKVKAINYPGMEKENEEELKATADLSAPDVLEDIAEMIKSKLEKGNFFSSVWIYMPGKMFNPNGKPVDTEGSKFNLSAKMRMRPYYQQKNNEVEITTDIEYDVIPFDRSNLALPDEEMGLVWNFVNDITNL